MKGDSGTSDAEGHGVPVTFQWVLWKALGMQDLPAVVGCFARYKSYRWNLSKENHVLMLPVEYVVTLVIVIGLIIVLL